AVTDPVLSKHLRTLHEAGYVTLTKPTGRGGRVRTWVSLTSTGRRAFEAHVAELQRLTGQLAAGPNTPGRPTTPTGHGRTAGLHPRRHSANAGRTRVTFVHDNQNGVAR